MTKKKKKKKIKFVNRHRIPLKETRMFTPAVEREMYKLMLRDIPRAFPYPMERASYLSSLIRELTDQIEANVKEDVNSKGK